MLTSYHVSSRSMLFRFREAQQAELGLTNRKTDRRPRLASSVNTLRECERWRGEILREISRKVSKIQDCECRVVLGPRLAYRPADPAGETNDSPQSG